MDQQQGAGMQIADPHARSTIPPPPNFPVTWEEPRDASLLWEHERGHWPQPVTPLCGALVCDGAFERGWNAGLTAYALPVHIRFRRTNTYIYRAFAPVVAPPEDLQAHADLAQANLAGTMNRLAALWATEWLPEVRQHLGFWEGLDLPSAGLPALLAYLDETLARFERLWELHALLTIPAHLAVSMFDDGFRQLFGEDDPLAAYRLLQGFDNKIVETDRALWQLSRRARAEPQVLRVLEHLTATDVPRQLEHSPAGHVFAAELRGFLTNYGQRSEFVDVAVPSWLEEPAPVVRLLKDYITQPDRDLQAERTAMAAQRDRRVAETREQLAGLPGQVVTHFEFLLKAAQEATVLEEEHNFWIDAAGTYHVRRVLLEFGRRFADARVIDQRSDVFFLTLDELRAISAQLANPHAPDHRKLVAGRVAEMAYFRTVTPPAVLGTLSQGSPADTPFARMATRLAGGRPRPSTEPGALRGNAGSPGIVRGPAKVIRSLAEAREVQPGDVLVAEATTPPWTPLFATVAAVVTDTGGILSHGAIIAREYGIPAVVGTGTATKLIRDGQMLEVDGGAGIVRII